MDGLQHMARIELERGEFCVDAALIAEGLGIEPALVQRHMRAGRIASWCERGIDEDAGRHRLTFSHENRRLRLVVDERGNIVKRSTDMVSDPHQSVSRRKPRP